jgi:thiol-disulfide isomerase/thioredoxin
MRSARLLSALVLFGLLTLAGRAQAIPAFARKYKTSCVTCHTIFPKLTPFGEQFRRNGFRFPGIDSDSVKAEPIALGTDESKKAFPDQTWPATLSSFPPMAVGLNGTTMIHPDPKAGAAGGSGSTYFNADGLVAEGHLWTAGSIDDSITFFSELTVADGGIELENASLFFGDLIGPDHALNLAVGKRTATLTSFGPHSTYVADMALPMIPVTGMFGATSDPFIFTDNHNSIELNGVCAHRFNYAAGVAAGTNASYRNSANVYAHVGYKLGGSNLDGEDIGKQPQDQEHEQSLTLDAFFYRSISRFNDGSNMETKDVALTLGGSLRAQAAALEFNAGGFLQHDDHYALGSNAVTTIAQWDELSYLLYPWLVVAARVDYLSVSPDGGQAASDLKITPGVAALLRPNLKLAVAAPIEHATGSDAFAWAPAGLSAAPASGASATEIESVTLTLFTAF